MKQAVVFLLLTLFALPSSASVVIVGTRIIYPSGSNGISVQLLNKANSVHLAQTWIDDGQPDAKPEDLHVPFIVSPAVVKVAGNNGQTLKIKRVGDGSKLPKDREAVYWLNMLDIPPAPENNDGKNYLQMAVRSRIKMFWRPDGLAISQNQIPQNIKFSSNGKGVCIDNKTPYHITLVQLMRWDGKSQKVQDGAKKDHLIQQTMMITPFSCKAAASGELNGKIKPGKYQLVRLDDFGAKVPFVVNAD